MLTCVEPTSEIKFFMLNKIRDNQIIDRNLMRLIFNLKNFPGNIETGENVNKLDTIFCDFIDTF